ncbi:MAG: ABC transporter ATP-binding protein [Acidimicrobiia bacterium]
MSRRIHVAGVSKAFDGVAALDDVGFSLEAGSFTAVVGASGSGKTTMLRLIAGMLEPTSGSIAIGDQTPDEARRDKSIGWMAQQPALLPWRTALDNVSLAQSISPRPDRATPPPAALLDMVGMAEFGAAYPLSLSGGMQQRVALARTLAIGAPVWLMDEPFSALDEITREAVADDLLAIWADLRPTVVWVTHHIPEAVRMADRIVLLSPRPGKVAEIIDVALIRPRNERSAAFQDVVGRARSVLRLADDRSLEAAQ